MNVPADAFNSALVHSLWQDTFVGLLLWGALVVLRHSSANARYVVCCAALALMAALPIATTIVFSERGVMGGSSTPALVSPAPPADDTLRPTAAQPADAARPLGWLASLKPWMLPIWLAGVMACSLRLVMAGLHTVALRRRSDPEQGSIAAMVAALAARIGVSRSVSVRISTMTEGPATLGFLRPVILLPPAVALGVTPQQLEALLAHELAHIRRHDYLVNVLQMLAETLFFYHPAVWWASRRIRIERELCCDDIAVNACGDAVGYAQALTRVARLQFARPGMTVGATGGAFLQRIHRLLGVASTTRPVSPLWIAAASVVLIVAVMFTGPYAQSQSPGTLAPVSANDDTVLRGRVVDARSGQPVPGASVRAQYITGVDNPTRCPIGDCESINDGTGRIIPVYRAIAGADGHFNIRGLKSGDYLVAAVAPGYVQRYFGETSNDMPEMPVHVAVGLRAPSIDVRLERAGSVSGRILSDAGEGLPGVEVELLRYTYLPNGSQPVPIAFAQTEERGSFRFGDVTPGEYFVRAYAARAIAPTRKQGASLSYAATLFPETTDITFAQPLSLASGQELTGVDFALMTTKMSVVSGRLVDPNGASLATAMIHLIPFPSSVDEVRKVSATADGTFRFDNVAASNYMVTVSDTIDGRSWNTAVRDLTVPGDATDLLLVAGPSVWVEGRVVREGGGSLPFDPSDLGISTIQHTSSAGFHGAGSSKVNSNGSFLMRSGAGRLSLRVVGMPPRWFLKSAQLDGVDVTDVSFDLTAGRQRRLDLTLSDRVSRLSGTVTDRSARPVSNALVVVFPDNRERWTNASSIHTTFSRPQGGYEIDGLPIANYRVVAVTSLPNRAWTDPEVLERLWPSAAPLSLDGLGESALHLKVVPPPTDLIR
jgi:beta-lactamase regulating signal transducer with metallopeptidase domain